MTDQQSVYQPLLFNYSALDAETTSYLRQNAQATRMLLKRTSEDILQIGKNLLEAKARLPHGQYLPWVQVELGISQSTAWRFTQAALGKPVKSFKMNDLLSAISEPKKEEEEGSDGPSEQSEQQAPPWPVTHPFLTFLRGERADFDQMLTMYEHRVTWLQSRQCALDEDDIVGLLWEEIEQFAGIRATELLGSVFDSTEPFDLERETERIRFLSDQMQTAQGGLFGLTMELGLRLRRVEQFFAREEENQVRQAVILRRELEWVSEALRLGHEFLPVAEVLTPEQLTIWACSEFGLQPEQTHALCASARRYPAETEVSEIDPSDRWTLASLWFDVALAHAYLRLPGQQTPASY